MSTRTEIKITKGSSGYYDISIDSSTQDLTVENSYDTDIICSFFTDKRADEAQIQESSRRRGWIGDTVSATLDYAIGSWNWLLKQERITNETVNKAVSYVEDCLKWITDLGLATRILVTGEKSGITDIKIYVRIYVQKDLVGQFTILVWENSVYK